MRETIVKGKLKDESRNPVLIEGLPGLGLVGKIATRFLIKQLDAKKFAVLYSPHFPYYVLVNKRGSVRLLRDDFHFWRNGSGGNDLIILTGDSQAQTIEGQYEVANCILDFAKRLRVRTIVTVGGYRKEVEDPPKVVAAATSDELLKKALQEGATVSPAGNPIVGTAGLLLGLAKFRGIDALCLLGETWGYLPDPKAAKSVLEVLLRVLKVEVDLRAIDKEIEKSTKIFAKMREIEGQRERFEERVRRTEEGRTTYIS